MSQLVIQKVAIFWVEVMMAIIVIRNKAFSTYFLPCSLLPLFTCSLSMSQLGFCWSVINSVEPVKQSPYPNSFQYYIFSFLRTLVK